MTLSTSDPGENVELITFDSQRDNATDHTTDSNPDSSTDTSTANLENHGSSGEETATDDDITLPLPTETTPEESAEIQPVILEQLAHSDDDLPTKPIVPAETVKEAYGLQEDMRKEEIKAYVEEYAEPETVSLEPLPQD